MDSWGLGWSLTSAGEEPRLQWSLTRGLLGYSLRCAYTHFYTGRTRHLPLYVIRTAASVLYSR